MFPKPVPGQVVRYAYLWNAEHERGQEEGIKDRPCAVILAVTEEDGKDVVTVLPITHAPPHDPTEAVEIPPTVKRRLGLDDARSRVKEQPTPEPEAEAEPVQPETPAKPVPPARTGDVVVFKVPVKPIGKPKPTYQQRVAQDKRQLSLF